MAAAGGEGKRFPPTVEINALAQHGYEVARKLCRRHHTLGDAALPDSPPWAPISSGDLSQQDSSTAPSHGLAMATSLSRTLRKSSRRRVWNSFIDWRDWPSYCYLAIALVFLFYLPLQVFQLYRKSQVQTRIIQSIASGDPDIRQILKLASSDPTSDWIDTEVREKAQPAEVSYEGVELLSHSRIYDLRRWDPDQEKADRRGHVYILDRITLKLLESYKGDGRIIFRFPSRVENPRIRLPDQQLQGIISRVSGPIEVQGQPRNLYEFEYDLSRLLPGEPVTIEVEIIADFPKSVRAPMVTHTKTDLISVWLLFPPDRPYRTYNLVSYPIDKSQPARVMNRRYAIDHPYGSLIGWSVVNPEEDRVYECQWTTE